MRRQLVWWGRWSGRSIPAREERSANLISPSPCTLAADTSNKKNKTKALGGSTYHACTARTRPILSSTPAGLKSVSLVARRRHPTQECADCIAHSEAGRSSRVYRPIQVHDSSNHARMSPPLASISLPHHPAPKCTPQICGAVFADTDSKRRKGRASRRRVGCRVAPVPERQGRSALPLPLNHGSTGRRWPEQHNSAVVLTADVVVLCKGELTPVYFLSINTIRIHHDRRRKTIERKRNVV